VAKQRSVGQIQSVWILVAILAAWSLDAAAQSPATSKSQDGGGTKKWSQSRTAWGDPDIQGIWTSNSVTGVPLERPKQFGTREFLSDEEYKQRLREGEVGARDNPTERPRLAPTGGPEHWYEWWGRASRRTSLIVDPPDGRLPPLTPEGAKKFAVKEAHRKRVGTNWETFADADLFERCLTRGIPALMIPTAYNTGFQILQIPGYVVIVYEMFDTRFIPLDGRPHLDKNVGQLIGDSRGRWDGNTLVVETTNFSEMTDGTLKSNGGSPYTEPTSFRGTGANLRVVERWTRSDAGTINYEATVEDPTYWTRPWKMVVDLGRDDKYEMFEYACHEGNYGMANSLNGARVLEAAAQK
jgi:hypothetical protein